MENQEKNIEENESQSIAQVQALIVMVKNFFPDFEKYYPMIMSNLDKAQKAADDYLGDGDKIVIGFNNGGNTRVLSIDANKGFSFSNEPEKKLTKEAAIKRLSELKAEVDVLENGIANNIPIIIPANKEFTADQDAVLVNEGVSSFIENKVLGNGTVKYVLDYMKSEYNEKYIGQEPLNDSPLSLLK